MWSDGSNHHVSTAETSKHPDDRQNSIAVPIDIPRNPRIVTRSRQPRRAPPNLPSNQIVPRPPELPKGPNSTEKPEPVLARTRSMPAPAHAGGMFDFGLTLPFVAAPRLEARKCTSIRLPMFLPVHPSTHLCIYLWVCLFVCLSAHLLMRHSVCLPTDVSSVYPSIFHYMFTCVQA